MERFSVDDLGTIDRQGGDLYISGQVDNTGRTFTASAETGYLILGSSNAAVIGPTRITGGVLDASDGATWRIQSGELVDVTLASDMLIERVDVRGNLTLDDATLSVRTLDFRQDAPSEQALLGQGILSFNHSQRGNIYIPHTGSLTIGADIVVETSGGDGGIQRGALVNEGTLRSNAGDILTITPNEFINRGLIEIYGRTTIGGNTWANEGIIRIKPGGSLSMIGTGSLDDLGTLIDEGANEIILSGTLDITGQTLNFDDLNLTVPLTVNGGGFRGGVITSSSSGAIILGNGNFIHFDGVTLASNFTIGNGNQGARVIVENGLTLDNMILTLPEGASLRFSGLGVQPLEGTATILATNLPNTSAITSITGANLVIGENITIRNGTESFRELSLEFLENRGTILVEAPNSLVSIGDHHNAPTWTNNGLIRVSDGTLEFRGDYSIDEIGTIEHIGGNIVLAGNILNEGKTILQNQTTGVWQIRGVVHGGRIEAEDGVAADVQGRLESVTLAGAVNLFDEVNSTAPGHLSIRDFLAFENGVLTLSPFTELGISEHVDFFW